LSADALNRPDDRHEAAKTIRGLTSASRYPGPKRGQIDATLRGELGTILDWLACNNKDGRATKKAQNANTPGLAGSGVSVSVVAGVGFEPTTFRL
jgi:site-specific DNA recombinase